MTSLSGGGGDCTAVFVYVSCKPGTEEGFKAASLDNAKNSVQEEGIARFDCVQNVDDPSKFVLVEVYKNADAPGKHKETAHYAAWRDAVADMMAEPRAAVKYRNCFPATAADWDVTPALAGGGADGEKADLVAVHVFVECKEGTEEAFRAASLLNAQNSVKEPGIARFDVLQDLENPRKFCLVEVYRNPDAPAEHKKTEHYNTWRETVADMMAVDRKALKYTNNFPAADANWRMASL